MSLAESNDPISTHNESIVKKGLICAYYAIPVTSLIYLVLFVDYATQLYISFFSFIAGWISRAYHLYQGVFTVNESLSPAILCISLAAGMWSLCLSAKIATSKETRSVHRKLFAILLISYIAYLTFAPSSLDSVSDQDFMPIVMIVVICLGIVGFTALLVVAESAFKTYKLKDVPPREEDNLT